MNDFVSKCRTVKQKYKIGVSEKSHPRNKNVMYVRFNDEFHGSEGRLLALAPYGSQRLGMAVRSCKKTFYLVGCFQGETFTNCKIMHFEIWPRSAKGLPFCHT